MTQVSSINIVFLISQSEAKFREIYELELNGLVKLGLDISIVTIDGDECTDEQAIFMLSNEMVHPQVILFEDEKSDNYDYEELIRRCHFLLIRP